MVKTFLFGFGFSGFVIFLETVLIFLKLGLTFFDPVSVHLVLKDVVNDEAPLVNFITAGG